MLQPPKSNLIQVGQNHAVSPFIESLPDRKTSRIYSDVNPSINLIQHLIDRLQWEGISTCCKPGGLFNLAIADANSPIHRVSEIHQASGLAVSIVAANEAEQMQLENDLFQALELQEFHLLYQPIVTLQTFHVVGFEALLRWQHYYRGCLLPTVFLPLAERIALLQSLESWTLQQACQQLRGWQQQFPTLPLTMSVNISTLQFFQSDFVAHVEQTLLATGIAPRHLQLEIAECALIRHESASAIAAALATLGVRLCIDGCRLNELLLQQLPTLPIAALKLDREFIRAQPQRVNATLPYLTETLGIDVIAKGIETSDDLMTIDTLNCTHMQGYFVSYPLDQRAVGDWLAER